jgi:hypothetical protein
LQWKSLKYPKQAHKTELPFFKLVKIYSLILNIGMAMLDSVLNSHRFIIPFFPQIFYFMSLLCFEDWH